MEVLRISSTSVSAYQGIHGQSSHRGKGIGDTVDNLLAAIDDATESGKLTEPQADALKEILDKILEMLGRSREGSSSGGWGGASNLSFGDRQSINDDLREVSRQLFAAYNSQPAGSGGQVDRLFSTMDTDNNGSINKSELSAYVSSSSGAEGHGRSHFSGGQAIQGGYTRQASVAVSFSVYQSSYSVMA